MTREQTSPRRKSAGGNALACPVCRQPVKALGDGSFYCRQCRLPVDKPVVAPSPTSRSRGNAATDERTPAGPVLIRLASVAREEVRWLWEGRIPHGRLTGIVGDPGVGKSWLTLAVGTAVTIGASLPGQGSAREPGNVLLLTAEDGLADTVRPRMEDMGADLARVTVLAAVRDAMGRWAEGLGADSPKVQHVRD